MSVFGGAIISENGLVASSDYPGYMKHEIVTAFSRSGNVNTFFTSSPTYPLVFAKPAGTDAVGVLAIRAASGGYYVDVLCDGSCSLIVFRALSGSALGFGLAFYNAAGALTFSSEKDMLAANSVASMAEGVSAAVVGDAVSYSAAHLKAYSSDSASTIHVTTDVQITNTWSSEYQCHYESEYICHGENQTVPYQEYACGYDFLGNYTCNYVTSYRTQWVTVCGFEQVQRCGFVQVPITIQTITEVRARIKTTSWSLYRGAVFFDRGVIKFRWVLHKSGFFKTVISFYGISGSSVIGDAPVGYVPNVPYIYASDVDSHVGEILPGGTFPYTNSVYNGGVTYSATLRSADYV